MGKRRLSYATMAFSYTEYEGDFMNKVYCYSKCTTCQKALKWLDDNQIVYEVIDIKGDHLDEETLRALHKKSGLALKRFFNTSGLIYRELGLAQKLPDMSEEEMFRLLASDGMLVKRPLLVTDKGVFPLSVFLERKGQICSIVI